MPGTLPSLQCCDPVCDTPSTVEVPGPPGDQGDPGNDGAAGASAFTTFTLAFTMPAELGSAVATVVDTSWMAINQIVYAAKSDGSVIGYFQATAIGGSGSVTLKNLEDAATGVYASNSAPGSIFPIGAKLCPGGLQGPNGTASGQTAGGDLKGTYLNPKIGIGNTKGSSLWGNGTDTVAVPAGTNGHMLTYDSTDAEGVKSFKALPLTGDTNVADNALLRLDGATGLPIPAQACPMTQTDLGALQTQYGNAKGTEAVDLQPTHSAVTQVASGAQSVISGGKLNTAAGAQSTVSGGDTNSAGGVGAAVGGGVQNSASATYSTIPGGNANTASAIRTTVGGGISNTASAQGATVAGGETNSAIGIDSTVGGGVGNLANNLQSTVAGGNSNVAAATGAFIGGGAINAVTGAYGSVVGGNAALADKYGQKAFAAGSFAATGDAQGSDLVMRNATTNATPTELFLDGASLRCTIPVGTSWMFQIMLVARRDNGLTSIYKSEGLITNVAGAVTMPAAATTTEIYDGIGLPATPVAVTADNVNDAMIITCTGVAATNVRWVARVTLVEVLY